MNIVISAYECSPDHGSEAGLGWSWVQSACRNDEIENIYVVTTDRYKTNIENYCNLNKYKMNKVKFYFLPLPLSNLNKLNQRFKYILWQKNVSVLVNKISKKNDIDYVHHVTWATCVLPTYLYKTDLKLIYGPVGGGERIPKSVNIHLEPREKITELIRNILANISVYFTSNINTYKKAECILVTTEETRSLIPKIYHYKTEVMQSIGLDASNIKFSGINNNEDFTILIAGRMIYWKGIDIAIEVMNRIRNIDSSIKLKIAGTGKKLTYYKQLASNNPNIVFLGNIKHQEMIDLYDSSDLLMNCSLHDSGCMVVLEAMGRGCPIITIDTGGPSVLTDETCAIKIPPSTYNEMVSKMCEAILELKCNTELRKKLGENATKRAKSYFLYDDKYTNILKVLTNIEENRE